MIPILKHALREFSQSVTNNKTGNVTVQQHHLMAVGGSLNYIENGQWRASEDLVELTPDGGAAALRMPNKLFFGGNAIVRNQDHHTQQSGLHDDSDGGVSLQ